MDGGAGHAGRKALNRARLRRGLILAVSLSAATLIAISLATLDRSTFSAVSNLSALYLILAAALSLGRWLWSAVRMRLLVASTGRTVPFRNILKTVYAGYFCGLITPWRAGGVAGEVVFLYQYGLEAGESAAVVSFGACISTLLLMLFFPLAIWLSRELMVLSFTIQSLLYSALFIGFVYLALVLWAILSPHTAVGNTLLNHSPSFLRKRDRYRRFLDRLSSEIQAFAASLREIVGLGKARLAAVVALTVLYWVTGFAAMPIAVVGLGYRSLFWKAVVAQLVVQILMPFVPVPGGSGVGEVGFVLVYSSIFSDAGVAALLALIWRFVDFYLGLVVGGATFLLIMRDIGAGRRGGLASGDDPAGPGEAEGREPAAGPLV